MHTHMQLMRSDSFNIIVIKRGALTLLGASEDELKCRECTLVERRAEAAVRSKATVVYLKAERRPQELLLLCREHALSDWRQCVNVTCAIEPSDHNFSALALMQARSNHPKA
jgi:hypothetical protein